MKRKLIVITLIFALALSIATPALAETNEIYVFVDGTRLNLDVNPVISDGRTLVPMRQIFEALGYEIKWDDATQQITATRENSSIQMQVNSKQANVNGRTVQMDVAATVQNGRTLVPLRFVGEASGATVDWDNSASTIHIGTQQTAKAIKPAELVGKWVRESGALIYYFHEASEIEFFSGNEVIEYGNWERGNWLLDDQKLTIQGNDTGKHIFTISLSEGKLTIRDSDNDTATYKRLDSSSQSLQVKMYKDFPSIPDFGAFMGEPLQAQDSLDGTTFYYYRYFDNQAKLEAYVNLLENYSFVFGGSFEIFNYTRSIFVKDTSYITLGFAEISEDLTVFVVMINPNFRIE